MTCNVTGTAISPSGQIKPGAKITFRRAQLDVVSQEGSFVIPDDYIIQTAINGTVNFNILPGVYDATTVAVGGHTVAFRVSVPNEPAADFADLLNASYVEIPPASVTQAQQARDEAIAARNAAQTSAVSAQTSADAAALYDGPWIDTVSAILSDTTLTYTAGQPATVSAGDYVRTRAEGFSYEVAAPLATDAHITTAGGVGVRVSRRDKVSPLMFGAKSNITDPGFNSGPAFVACLAHARDTGASVIMDDEFNLEGGFKIPFGVRIEWENGAWTRQTRRSVTGGFLLTNGVAPDGVSYLPMEERSGITLINPQIDGSAYPTFEGEVASVTDANTFTLGASASSVDNFYNGDVIEITSGSSAGVGSWAYILDYDGATRTVVIDTTRTPGAGWGGVPDVGATVRIGYNDPAILFGFGTRHTVISGGHIKNLPWTRDVAYGYGAKAINLERGHVDCIIENTLIQNCGAGLYLSGRPGVWSTADPYNPRTNDSGIKARGIRCENVGAPLVALGQTVSPGPSGNPDDLWFEATGWTCKNVGHNPNRLLDAGDTHEKSAPIILGGAENGIIKDWQIWNESTYPETSPGYPSETLAIGNGLTGPIGSVVKGWGRNIVIDGIEYHGDCDTVVLIKRPRELNVDAGNTNILHGERFDVQNFRHFGAADYFVDVDPQDNFKIARSQLTGHWLNIQPGTLSGGFVGPNMAAGDADQLPYLHVYAEFVRPGSASLGRALVRGRLADIADTQNSYSSLGAVERYVGGSARFSHVRSPFYAMETFTTADDAVTTVPLTATSGIVMITSRQTGLRMMFDFRTTDPAGNPSAQVGSGPLIPANTSVTTGALSAGGGADASFNIGIGSNGIMYVSNRRGGSVTWSYTVIGALA